MSEGAPYSFGNFDPGGWRPLEPRGAPGGFRSDVRFVSLADQPASTMPQPAFDPEPFQQAEPEDPIAIAFAEGYAAGIAEAKARAADLAAKDAAAREGLALALGRLDRELEETLRQRLRDTVAALCEAAIAPLAIDEDALMRRIERAVALFARIDDERVIRLHPDDIALLAPRFTAEWQVLPDAALERGSLRVETASGGIEDGPELWRRAIAEALHQC
jgi:flagellar assembly protein FliH